jgi:hypothetical protein
MLRQQFPVLCASCVLFLSLASVVEAGGGLFSRLGKNRRSQTSGCCQLSQPGSTAACTPLCQSSCSPIASSSPATNYTAPAGQPCMADAPLHPPQFPGICLGRFTRDYQCCIHKHKDDPQVQEACLKMALRRYQYCMGDLPQNGGSQACLCDQPYHGCDPSAPDFYSCFYNCGYECTGYSGP